MTRDKGSDAIKFVIGATLFAEGALVLMMMFVPERVGGMALLQLAAAGGLCWYGRWRHRTGQPLSAPLVLFGLAVIALGPLGVLGGGVMILAHRISVVFATPFDEWYASLFPRAVKDPTRRLYEMLSLRGTGPSSQNTVTPFGDVLALGSVDQKHTAVTLIADNFRPEFAEALQQALNSSEPAIRVQAASAVARIENGFLQRLVEIEGACRDRPGDLRVRRELARHHQDYAASGLLDSRRAAATREQALELNLSLLEQVEDDQALIDATAQLFVQLGRPREALHLLAPWLQDEAVQAPLLSRYMEALYAARDFARLRTEAVRLARAPGSCAIDAPLRDALQLWAGSNGGSRQ